MLCVNTPGSYRCVGKTGYIATVENVIFVCKDINQCLTGSHGCQGNCSNAEGSYVCTCTEGLLLQNDGFSCKSQIFNMHLVNIQLKIKEWIKMSYNDCIRVAQDRERWRSMTADLLTTDGT